MKTVTRLRLFDMVRAVWVAAVATPEFKNFGEGSKIAGEVLLHINDEQHRNILASLPDDPTSEQWDKAVEPCRSGECTTKKYLLSVDSYDELKAAAKMLDHIRTDIDSAIEGMRHRAAMIDPERFEADNPPDLNDMLSSFFGGRAVVVGMDNVTGSPDRPVS